MIHDPWSMIHDPWYGSGFESMIVSGSGSVTYVQFLTYCLWIKTNNWNFLIHQSFFCNDVNFTCVYIVALVWMVVSCEALSCLLHFSCGNSLLCTVYVRDRREIKHSGFTNFETQNKAMLCLLLLRETELVRASLYLLQIIGIGLLLLIGLLLFIGLLLLIGLVYLHIGYLFLYGHNEFGWD